MNYKPAIFLVICVFFLLSPATIPLGISNSDNNLPLIVTHDSLDQMWKIASAGDSGLDSTATMFMSREIVDQSISIMNFFVNTDHHNGTFDLSEYQISGWTLYQVDMNVDNLTAIEEREVMGVAQDTYECKIWEYDAFNGYRYNSLTQGFFNQPYNGSLLNYSFYYEAPIYTPAVHNWAVYSILSDYSNSSSNLMVYTQLPAVGFTATWENVSVSSTVLDMNTEYFVTVNGSTLIKNGGFYPEIRWWSDAPSGSYETRRYDSGGSNWISYGTEALLNYTYIPWNKTSNAALLFQSNEVELRANTTSLSGSSWTWTSSQNITSIEFDSNQSIYLNHDLTLWYKRDVQANTLWDVVNSGDDVDWNVTSTLSYPMVSSEMFLNVTVPSDWTETGLYNSTTPSINYENHTRYSNVIQCENLTNGSWILTFTAHNYVNSIEAFETSSILTNLEIISTIKDSSLVNATNGDSNATVWHNSVLNWTDISSVTNGAGSHTWDIDTTTNMNGSYKIEVFWSNGTEAGYLTKQVVVYYPTEFGATDYTINAYTEDSFEIRVSYNDTFTAQGLDGSSSTVEYSFDGAANTTMTDHSNGTWTASVSTVGKGFGTFDVDVYAEGFAIENQTLTITVSLLHDTLPLVGIWSQPYEDNITYTQSTNLTILYQRTDGTNVTDAMVNVTIDGGTYDFQYDAINEFYWIQFNGSDFTGFDTFSLTIQAWKAGYEPRSNSTLSLIVREEPTTLTLTWTFTTIDYLGQIDLTVEYWYGGTSVPAISPNVNMTINGGSPIQLNQSGDYWTANFTGQYLELGSHNIVVYAWAYGYTSQTDSETLTVTNVTTNALVILWEPLNVTIPYTSSLNLTIDYTYASGDVPSATVNVTINGVTYPLTYSAGLWYVSISGESIGVNVYSAFVSAWAYGYNEQTNVTTGVTITLAANSFIVDWIPSDLNMTYVETLLINVTYTHDFQPILGATVQLIVNGTDVYGFFYNATTGKYHLTISAITLGLGMWNTTVRANKTGYDTGVEYETTMVNPDPCQATPNWTDEQIYYIHSSDLNITLLDSFGQPITDAIVNATYDGSNYDLTHLGLGIYRLVLNGSDGMDNYSITVYTYRYGFVNRTVNVELEIIETPTYFDLNETINLEQLYYDGWVIYSAYYEDDDSIPITSATVNLILGARIFPLVSHGNGTYSVNLTGTELGIGLYSGYAFAELYGFESGNHTAGRVVETVPTRLDYTTVPTIMFINDTALIEVTFVNEHTEQGITPAYIQITWAGEDLFYESVGDGVYRFSISSSDLALTSHELIVQFGLDNYSMALEQWDITIRAVFTTFTSSATYSQYENETITLTATFRDVDHDRPIDFADVTATIGIIEYEMIHQGNGVYSVTVYLDIDPDEYTVTFTASANGCESGSTTATLTVQAKAQYVLVLDVNAPQEGATLGVTVTVTMSGDPVSGLSIDVYVRLINEDGSTVLTQSGVTTSEGITQVNFDIPLNTDEIEVWAEFDGSISEWQVTTEAEVLSVQPPSSGIFETLTDFFLRTTLGNILMIVIMAAVVGGTVYAKVIRPKGRKEQTGKEQQYERFVSLYSLKHFMAVYLDRGTCVFYHPFSVERIQPDLLSGFITAITSVYGEIKGDGVRGTLEVLQYQGLYLNNYSGEHIIGMLILEEEMSPLMMERLEAFVEMFEIQYNSDLTGWTGIMDCFNPEWIVETLYGLLEYDLLVPHRLLPSKKVRGIQKKVVGIIESELDELKEFSLRDIIPSITSKSNISDEEAFDILMGIRDLGYLIPISIQNILLRQGMGLVNGDEDEDMGSESDPVVEDSKELDEESETRDITKDANTENNVEKTEEVSEEPALSEEDKFLLDVEDILKDDKEEDSTDE